MDDDSLIAAVAAGDEGAFRALFTLHAPWLAARLRRTLPADAVEDVLQETFIAVWRGAASYKGDGALGAWLWGIARRQAALWARGHGRSGVAMDAGISREDPAATAAARADLLEALNALGQAGNQDRELARLRFIEDRPIADIAARLGIPEGTVKSRVFAVRRRLRATLRRGGD
jgi:RNA polymerase sigma-70 factor (ECF subfamily)